MNTKIVTYTGKLFDLLNPKPDMVCIEDIAHHLSLICRYTGAVSDFYSVAQHCVLMAEVNSPVDPLKRLLHDAGEAYIGDIASPWKQLLWVKDPITGYFQTVRGFEQMEIQTVIGLALDVNLDHSAEVKKIDNRMYLTEIRDLMPPSTEFGKWKNGLEPFEDKIICWESWQAKMQFLMLYKKLKGV